MLRIKNFLRYQRCKFCQTEFLEYCLVTFNNKDFICNNCKRVHDYTTKNTIKKGKEKLTSFSFEFETSRNNNKLYELLQYHFLACSDGSIGGTEWKSPIFYSKKAFHNVCKKIDKFAYFVGSDCGTHLHVGTSYKVELDQYKEKLFQPIINKMKSDRDVTVIFWGRYFNSYCESRIIESRYNCFNTKSHVDTLEFRLLKFISAEQYIRACDFCIEVTKFLNQFIANKGIDEQKAQYLGDKILEKYEEVIRCAGLC